jgi:hypothetical protein
MPAPLGNGNANKGKVWREAIRRALEAESRRDGIEALEAVAASLIAKAKEGDIGAIKELGDRLDGKPAQAVALTDAEGGPVAVRWKSE